MQLTPPRSDRLAASLRNTLVVAFASAPCVALAAEFAGLRAGMWEFRRMIEGQLDGGAPASESNQRCADPVADMRRIVDLLVQRGCKVSPLAGGGDKYSYSTQCRVGSSVRLTYSVIKVESDSAYTVDVVSNDGGRPTKEQLVAKRVGDC